MTDITARFRTILRLDALLCAASAVVLLATPGTMADLLDAGSPTALRWVGVGLAVYGADLAFTATRRPLTLRAATLGTALGDAAWVVGSVALVATGAVGVVALPAALPVAVVGVAKVVALQAERATTSTALTPA